MTLTSSLMYQSGKVGDKPFVLTGPVIGMVTDSTARILIETNIACTVECKLKTSDDTQITRTISIDKRTPKCFQFDGLIPDTQYRISLSIPCPGLVKAGFMTMPKAWSLMSTPARLGFVTGNNYIHTRDNIDEKVDLWKSLFTLAHKGQIDYLIHVGDNVQLDSDLYRPGTDQFIGNVEDNRWQTAMKALEGVSASEWPKHFETVCEIFKGSYRETWNHPMTKHTLANIPNLMILNDHDICTNFGDRVADFDPYSREYFLSCCAYEVYNQYQRNLFEEYTPQPTPYACTSEVQQAYHFHVVGDIGVMMLDVRAARTFHRNTSQNPEKDDELPLLGHRQWKDIEFALSETGYFSGCRMLFIISPTPPAVVGESGSKFLQSCKGGAASRAAAWYPDESLPEASYLLSLMFDWRAKNPGQRELCIVSGGMGQGFMTDIVDTRYSKLFDGRLDRIKQIALGPVANGPATIVNKKVLSQALGKINSVAPHHQFKHYNLWENSRQFGVIDVYLDYNELHPEYGIVTKFTAQVTAANAEQLKTLKPIDNTFRQRGNFKGSFFGMCDPGAERRGCVASQNGDNNAARNYSLLSTSEKADEETGSVVPSANGTFVSVPASLHPQQTAPSKRKSTVQSSVYSVSSSYTSTGRSATMSQMSSSCSTCRSSSMKAEDRVKKSRNFCRGCRQVSKYSTPSISISARY